MAVLEPLNSNTRSTNFDLEMETETSIDQKETAEACVKCISAGREQHTILKTVEHKKFLRVLLDKLPTAFTSLDASRPWMIYWGINGLAILGDQALDLRAGVSSSVMSCAAPGAGFGGAYGQVPHLASSYAGLLALVHSEDTHAWEQIHKVEWRSWLLSLKMPNGSFRTSARGEADTRSTYCALVIASLLDELDEELCSGTAEYIASCQTYEGGFANMPYGEAHAGYAFCALAGLCLCIGDPKKLSDYINLAQAVRWLSSRQSSPEGGFSGRTNKLVDGCYDHWAGGCWPFLQAAIGTDDTYDRKALQDFVLYCNQVEGSAGGLRDKPGCRPDAYHSNYVLAGLAGSQSRYQYTGENKDIKNFGFNWKTEEYGCSVDDMPNQVNLIHPVYVVPVGMAEKFHDFFAQ